MGHSEVRKQKLRKCKKLRSCVNVRGRLLKDIAEISTVALKVALGRLKQV